MEMYLIATSIGIFIYFQIWYDTKSSLYMNRQKSDCLFTSEWFICTLQRISAAEYSIRDASQHGNTLQRRRQCGEGGVVRFSAKSYSIKCKLWKSFRKQLGFVCKTPRIPPIKEVTEKCTCFYREKSASRRFHRPLRRGSMACHTTCFMRTHFIMTGLCSTIPDFLPNIKYCDQLREHIWKTKNLFFKYMEKLSSDNRVIWSLLFVIPEPRHCNSPPTITCARSSKRRHSENRFVSHFLQYQQPFSSFIKQY